MQTTDLISLIYSPPENPAPRPSLPVTEETHASELCYDLSNPHIIRMALYSIEIARCCGVDDPYALDDIYFAAILHDVGKTALRAEVLNKPGALTRKERAHVETHAAIGGEMVNRIPGWNRVSRAVRAHHEWWDGTGYPDRLKGDEIPLPARIVAVADVFDALTSLRPYREPLPANEVIRHIESEAGTHFDPEIVGAFLKIPELEWKRYHEQAEGLTSAGLLQVHTWYF